jgi:sugar lactone lactonase YvrE
MMGELILPTLILPAGCVNGIIAKPQREWLVNAAFGGANFDELFVASSGQLFKRKTTVKGVRSAEAPIKPEKPRL